MRRTLQKITQISQEQRFMWFSEEVRTGPRRCRRPPAAPPAARRGGPERSPQEVESAGRTGRKAGAGCGVRSATGAGGDSSPRQTIRTPRAAPARPGAGWRRYLARLESVPRGSGAGGWTMAVSTRCSGAGSRERPCAESGAARRTAGSRRAGCSRDARDGGFPMRRRRCRPPDALDLGYTVRGPAAAPFPAAHRPPSPRTPGWSPSGITPRRCGSSASARRPSGAGPTLDPRAVLSTGYFSISRVSAIR